MKRIRNARTTVLCVLSLVAGLAHCPVVAFAEDTANDSTDAYQISDVAAEDQDVLIVDGPVMVVQSEDDLVEQDVARNSWVNVRGSYYFYGDQAEKVTGWLVCGTTPQGDEAGLQRYWLDPTTGELATDRLITPDEAGWWAYARPEGYVVRGRYVAADGKVYLANNDGKLEDPGWLVSNSYNGGWERYWVDAQTHACVPGYSAEGWDHYTRPEGYVVRGKYVADGKVYLANNDGKLEDPGWLVSNSYDGGWERYWVDAQTHACVPGYSADGWKHYTTNAGYVLRGYSTEGGVFRYADNDGRISDGWMVTDKFGQSLQRYWQQDGRVVADQLIDAGNGVWGYARPEGYVVRGKWVSPTTGFMYVADNDGKLEKTGWKVTNEYGDGFQRYYFSETSHAAEPGFFKAPQPRDPGKEGSFYAVEGKCYVLRGKQASDDEGVLLADNDGLLAETVYGEGMITTDAYDGSKQKYYLANVDGHLYAKTGFFELNGKSYYGDVDQGCLLTGKLKMPRGIMLADSEGVLAESYQGAGWLISDKYDKSIQRYYLTESYGHLYAREDFFTVDGQAYYGIPQEGYVLRGRYTTNLGVLLADNDGLLAENSHDSGMLVTGEFDGGVLQRYYFEKREGHLYAKTGLFTYNNKQYFGLTETGYVSRNETIVHEGKTYKSDNDGVLTEVAGTYTKTRDPYLATVTWSNDTNYIASMGQKLNEAAPIYAQKGAAATSYAITADVELCRVVVFQKSGSGWKAVKTLNANMGRNTYSGHWKIEHKMICNWDDSYFGKGYNDWSCCYIESYASYNVGGHSRFIPGKGYEDCQSFHSTGYSTTGYDNTGCIGLLWDEAKWIYDNCPVGTWTVVF